MKIIDEPYRGLTLAVGLTFTACLHEKNHAALLLRLASSLKLQLNGFLATHYAIQNHSYTPNLEV